MCDNIDRLFVETLDRQEILRLFTANENGSVYISHGISSLIANLYIPDDVEELDSSELRELKDFSKNQLETLLTNLQKVIEKFFEVQRGKNGGGLYFNFNDRIIFKTPIVYEKIENDESKLHPHINKIFTLAADVFQFLLGNYFSGLDFLKRVIQYLNELIDSKKNSPIELFAIYARQAKFQNEMKEMLVNIQNKIDGYIPFLKCFLDNIECCIERGNIQDIEYLEKYPDTIFGIIQSICRLPKTETVNVIINFSLYKLYLCQILPNNIRFDIFSCIVSNQTSVKKLLTEIINRQCPGILISDLYELYKLGASGLNDHTNNFIGILSIIQMYLKMMKKNGSFEYITRYITNNLEKTRSLIVGIFEYINKCVGEIFKEDNQLTTEMVDELTAEMHLLLTVIKYFIKLSPDVINCHLVHYVPYVIINIWNSYKDYLDTIITTRFAKILLICANNADFMNYFSNLISNNITQYEKLIYFDSTKVQKRHELFNKLSDRESEFIDPIQSTFILKVAFLPMTGSDPMLCDKYVIESVLRTKPFNPFTQQALTIEDFNKIQLEMTDMISNKENERKQFVLENR